jgi:hypothetical protein
MTTIVVACVFSAGGWGGGGGISPCFRAFGRGRGFCKRAAFDRRPQIEDEDEHDNEHDGGTGES